MQGYPPLGSQQLNMYTRGLCLWVYSHSPAADFIPTVADSLKPKALVDDKRTKSGEQGREKSLSIA
jgi:hypothetical protein